MRKAIAGIFVTILAGCGGGGLVGDDDPNKASVAMEVVDGQVVVTGFAGAAFSPEEIGELIVQPECAASDLEMSNLTLTPSGSGSAIRALCV